MSCLLIVCLFVFSKVGGTLQVHVHTGIQILVYSCITVLTFFFPFSFSLFGSLSLFSGFVLPHHLLFR